MLVGLLVELGILLLLGFQIRLIFLHELGCLLLLGEPRSHVSAILVPIGLLVQLGLLVQVGLRYQKSCNQGFNH